MLLAYYTCVALQKAQPQERSRQTVAIHPEAPATKRESAKAKNASKKAEVIQSDQYSTHSGIN